MEYITTVAPSGGSWFRDIYLLKTAHLYIVVTYTQQKYLLAYPYLSVQFSGIEYIHIAVQSSSPILQSCFHLPKLQLHTQGTKSSQSSLSQPLKLSF